MTSKKNIILGIGAATVLMVGFQNCSPAKFTETSNAIEKSSTDPVPSGEVVDPVPTSTPKEEEVIDPRQTEAREVKCDSTLVKAAIVYDSIADSQSAAVSYKSSAVSAVIDAEYISFVGNTAMKSLNITARKVDHVGSLATQSLSVNAQEIGFVGNLSANKIHLVGHSVQDPSKLAGDLCIAANQVPTIGHMAGSITVFGRVLNNMKASISSIANVAGFLSLYDVDVEVIQNLATNAKLDNVHLKTLQKGAGTLILVDSQIDQVDSFAGTIRLRGTSKIGNISQQTSVRVIQE